MFGIGKLKDKVSYLESELQKKNAAVPDDPFIARIGFDFHKEGAINNPIKEVPELAGILNYCGRSYVSGDFQVRREDEIISNRYENLFKKPNPISTERTFRMNLAEYIMAYGFCFVYKNQPGIITNTKGLYLLDPNETTIKTKVKSTSDAVNIENLKDIIKHVEVSQGGVIAKYKDIDKLILFVNDVNFSIQDYELKFDKPLDSLRNALEVTPALYDIMTSLANEGGVQGFISNRQTDSVGFVPLQDKEKSQLEKIFKNYGLKKKQSRVAISPSNVEYVETSAKIKDLAIDVQKRIIKETIADVIGFDAILLNSTEGKKYDNYKQARQSFFTELIMPLASVIDEAFTDALLPDYNENFHTDYSELDVFQKSENEKYTSIKAESEYIINLNKEVSAGTMSRETAIYFLIDNGYNEEIAEKLISKL